MKKQFWLLLILTISILLSGCASILPHEEKEIEPTINAGEWPSPEPTASPVPPTPFPKITLAPSPTPTTPSPKPTATPVVRDSGGTGGGMDALVERIGANLGLSPVGVGFVQPDEVALRSGPGSGYSAILTRVRGDLAAVLGKDASGGWYYVIDFQLERGWLPADSLRIVGDLEKTPVLPPDPIQALLQQQAEIAAGDGAATPAPAATIESISAPPAQPAAVQVSAPAGPSMADLTPVTTAYVNVPELDLRRGPGDSFGLIDTLYMDNKVEALALNEQRDWLLVRTPESGVGWLHLADMVIVDSLNNAPTLGTTGWVESNEIDLRRGPGIYYDKIGALAIHDMVAVLGRDEGSSWVLVKSVNGGAQGWAQVRFLQLNDRLANIPLAPAPPLEQPTPPPPDPVQAAATGPGQIVIQRASGQEIMVINPDGSDLRTLTHGIDPVLSPDGRTVAFTRWQGQSGSVWLIGLDGSNERSVFGFTKQAKGPDWSPDSSRIVINFQHEGRLDEKVECVAAEKAGRPPRNAFDVRFRLNDDNEPEVCWTLPEDPHWSLRVIDLADGSYQDVDGGTYAFRPAWDPARSWRIISDGGRGLVEVDLNREYTQPITDNNSDSSPVFSPDGRYLLVSSGPPGGGAGHDIYRLNADGKGRVQLTKTPLWHSVQPDNEPPWNNVAPAWSPDGRIAFLTDRSGRWEIWLMDYDGSNQHPLFSDEVNDQLNLEYHFVDERVISWR